MKWHGGVGRTWSRSIRHRARHRERIERSVVCGCFYCLAIYAPVEVTEWVDGPSEEDELDTGVTALCARCGIDAVLPDDVPGAPMSPELLSVMHQYFF